MNVADVTKTLKELEVYTSRSVTRLFAGNYRSSFRGQGIEVAHLREYVDGDDARLIDWMTSARTDKLYVKEYEETRELTTMVIVDVSASMNFGSEGAMKREAALRAAAILLYSAMKNGDSFGVVVFSDGVEGYVPAAKGQGHLFRVLREIVRAYGDNEYKETNTLEALEFFNRVVKKQSITFLISDELGSGMKRALSVAQSRHDFVFVNVFDRAERALGGEGLVEVEDPETGERLLVDLSDADLQRRFLENHRRRLQRFEKRLAQSRIDVVHLDAESSVLSQLMSFFKQRQARY